MPTRETPTRSCSRSARRSKWRKRRGATPFPAELKIVLAYAFVAALWIFFSDRALLLLFQQPEQVNAFQTFKGWAFVGTTAILLYFFIRRELSHRRDAEEALRQNEARLLVAQQIGQSGSWDVDLADNTLKWSAETFRIFQRDPLTFVPTCEAFLEMVHPDDRARMRKVAEEVRRADRDVQAEHRIILPNGAERQVIEHARIFRDSTGQPIRIIGTVQDITERKQAEASLQAATDMLRVSEQRNRILVEHAPEAIVVLDASIGRFVDLNENAVKLFGLDREALLKLGPMDLSPPVQADGRATAELGPERISQALSGATPAFEWIHRNASGEDIPCEVRLVRLPSPNQQLIRGSITDIRERKRFNAELEHRVLSRTAQLQAANEELEAFSYSVSHDLRAPLRHVLGFTNLLTRQPAVAADADSRRMAEVISKAALKMGNLIDDLLNFSRMGRTELRSEPVDLGKLVAEVRRELESGLADRQIQWNVSSLPVVLGDVAMLRQVFLNLLGNAIKYTRGQPSANIEVRCERGEKELVFAVSDNGVGFDMAYANRLFGVFQRLHRDDEFEGTGIGLANVRRIIVRHGGRTWAEGKVGEGATFYFSLPVGASAPREAEAQAPMPGVSTP
jgi:PAS domain S-box-containing protein